MRDVFPLILALGFEIKADMPSVAFQVPWRSGRGLIVGESESHFHGQLCVQLFASPCGFCTSARHPVSSPTSSQEPEEQPY